MQHVHLAALCFIMVSKRLARILYAGRLLGTEQAGSSGPVMQTCSKSDSSVLTSL